jgi:hypothetical protein
MPRYESPPVQSKSIDMRTLVALTDPKWRDPAEVYLFPNGRKFFEQQAGGGSAPPVGGPIVNPAIYEQAPAGSHIYYVSSADPTSAYVKV